MARVLGDNIYLEVTQDELNTLAMALGNISQDELEKWGEAESVEVCEDSYWFYAELLEHVR